MATVMKTRGAAVFIMEVMVDTSSVHPAIADVPAHTIPATIVVDECA